MKASDRLVVTEIYIRATDKEGNKHADSHWVWDEKLFLRALHRGARAVGGKSKVEQITKQQYDKERGVKAPRGK